MMCVFVFYFDCSSIFKCVFRNYSTLNCTELCPNTSDAYDIMVYFCSEVESLFVLQAPCGSTSSAQGTALRHVAWPREQHSGPCLSSSQEQLPLKFLPLPSRC